jgi:hypothetical protein
MVLYSRRELKIPEISLKPSNSKSDTHVGCLLVTRVGERHLRMSFYVAAEDRKQRDDMLHKLPVIKHDLLMSANRPEFLSALELRDFDLIREHLLMTVNQYAKNPIDHLFFESYYLD